MLIERCDWCRDADPLVLAYHDQEWGVPSHNDRYLFEMLILEGAQAGLSWSTILKRRASYRRAFAGFDPALIAQFDEPRVQVLLQDAGIVRNRLKIEAAIANARATLEVRQEFGSLDVYLWGFVEGIPVASQWRWLEEIPSQTKESRAMSKDLRRRGFRFVGPTICYAFMQGVGIVNDHTTNCFRHAEIASFGSNFASAG